MRAAGAGSQGEITVSVAVAAQDGGEAAALALDRAGRPAEEDGEGRGLAEALAGEVFAAGRGGALDRQRGRAQVVLDAEADQAEDDDRDEGQSEGRLGTATGPGGPRGTRRLVLTATAVSHRSQSFPLPSSLGSR